MALYDDKDGHCCRSCKVFIPIVCIAIGAFLSFPHLAGFLQNQLPASSTLRGGLIYEYQTLLAGLMAVLAGLFIYLVPSLEFSMQRKSHREAIRLGLSYQCRALITLAYAIKHKARLCEDVSSVDRLVKLFVNQPSMFEDVASQAKPEFFSEYEWIRLVNIKRYSIALRQSYDLMFPSTTDLASVQENIDSYIFKMAESIRYEMKHLLGRDVMDDLKPDDAIFKK